MAAGTADPARHRGLVDLLVRLADPALVPALVELLASPRAEAASSADRALVSLHEELGGVPGALVAALRSFARHGCRGAAHAALEALTPVEVRAGRRGRGELEPALGSSLGSWFWEERGAGHAALARVVAHSRRAVARRRAWEWLAHDWLAPACRERLSRPCEPGDHALVLSAAHLAVRPARAAALRGGMSGAASARGMSRARAAGQGAGVLPSAKEAWELPRGARRGLARVAVAMGVGEEQRGELLGPALGDADTLVRLQAAHAAPSWGAGVTLVDFCFDPSPAVARSALRAWSSAGAGRPSVLALRGASGASGTGAGAGAMAPSRWLARLARSADAGTAVLAREELERNTWEDASSPASRALARRLLADGACWLADEIARRLEGADPRVRQRTAQLVRALGAQGRFAAELAACAARDLRRAGRAADDAASGGAARATATVVAALGEAGAAAGGVRAAVRAALGAALEHPDARVRSNAVEALGADARARRDPASTPAVASIIELKDDPHHRVRASTLRALLMRPRAAGTGASPLRGAGSPVPSALIAGRVEGARDDSEPIPGPWVRVARPGAERGAHERGHERPRATMEARPIRIYEPAAVEGLLRMLRDERAEHRLAGAWAAQRVLPAGGAGRLGPDFGLLVERVEVLARSDFDARVRARAGACAARLRAERAAPLAREPEAVA